MNRRDQFRLGAAGDLPHVVDPFPFVFRHMSGDERPILLFNGSDSELFRKAVCGAYMFREEDRSRRGAVEPVRNPQIASARFILTPDQECLDPRFERVNPRRRLGQDPRFLVHRKDRPLLIENLKRAGLHPLFVLVHQKFVPFLSRFGRPVSGRRPSPGPAE